MITVMLSNKGPFQSVKTTWYSTGLSFTRHKRNNLLEETCSLWFLTKTVFRLHRGMGTCRDLCPENIRCSVAWVNMCLFLSQIIFNYFFFISYVSILTSGHLIFKPLSVCIISILLASLKYKAVSNIRSDTRNI